jgi:hypothetical protein
MSSILTAIAEVQRGLQEIAQKSLCPLSLWGERFFFSEGPCADSPRKKMNLAAKKQMEVNSEGW